MGASMSARVTVYLRLPFFTRILSPLRTLSTLAVIVLFASG